MANINVDSRVISNICKEDIRSDLQNIIHTELQKDENEINSDLVEECINALLEIEQDEDKSFVPLIALASKQEFIDKIISGKRSWKNMNRFARVAIVAAALAGSTVTANAAVEAVTGVNLLNEAGSAVHTTLQNLGIIRSNGIDKIQGEWEDDEEETTTTTVESTTAPEVTETTTEPTTISTTTTTTTTTAKPNIDKIQGEWEDDDETTTTTKPSTTNKPIAPTTAQSVTDKYKPEEKVVLTALEAEFDGNFKSDYIYGEELSYNGMSLKAVYSDGSSRTVSLSECAYTKNLNMDTTADYTLKITYQTAIVKVDITVRPDEETRGSTICEGDDFNYLLTNRGAYITAYKGSDKNITLNEIDGNDVVAICDSVFCNSGVESITAESLVKIFDNAFMNCETLTNITAPRVEYIGNNAFNGCKMLEQAVNSDSLVFIGKAAYKKTAIIEITLPKGIDNISESICEDCERLKRVDIVGRVENIGAFAFCECTALETVTGTDYIRSVGNNAFYNDTEVDFDTNVPMLESVGDYAFAFCNAIEFGNLPTSVKEIGVWSFAYCYGLTSASISNGITVIPNSAFRGAHLSSLVLPDGIVRVDDYAFMSTEIAEIRLPDSVKEIGTCGLYSTRLQRVYFGRNIEKLGSSALYKTGRLMLYVYKDTVPQQYAEDNNLRFTVIE